MAIDESITMEIQFNSRYEEFMYDMTIAYQNKNITPDKFRSISKSDLDAMKKINNSLNSRIELYQEQKRLEAENQAKVKAEMERRIWK